MTRVLRFTPPALLVPLMIFLGCGMFGGSEQTSRESRHSHQTVDVVSNGSAVYRMIKVSPTSSSETGKKKSEQPPTPPKKPEPTPTPSGPVLPTKNPADLKHRQPAAGDAIAQYNLALRLEAAGRLPEAAALYQKAADQKLREAEYNVGYMFAHGEGLPKSDVNAALWFQKAADQGLAVAQHMVGFLYEEGRGVPQSFEKAIGWHLKAAEQGFVDAQSYLGYLYAVGGTVEANPTEAAKWFLRAAENDALNAQFQIGIYLARGEGIEQDVVEGYKWLNIASLGNYPGAKAARAELIKQMRPASVTEAQKRTGEFIAKQQQK